MPCLAIFDLSGFSLGTDFAAGSVELLKRLLSWAGVVAWMALGSISGDTKDGRRLTLIVIGVSYFAVVMIFGIASMTTHMVYSQGDVGTTVNVALDLGICFLLPCFFGCCAAHSRGQEELDGKSVATQGNNALCPLYHTWLSMFIAAVMVLLAIKLCYSVCSDFTQGVVLFNFVGSLGLFTAGCALPFYFLEQELMPEPSQATDNSVDHANKACYDRYCAYLSDWMSGKNKKPKTRWPHGWSIYALECFDINTLIFGLLSIDSNAPAALHAWAIHFGFPDFDLESNGRQDLTSDWWSYYYIMVFNIMVFGVLAGSLLGVLLARAIIRDEQCLPMLNLTLTSGSGGMLSGMRLSKAILRIIFVLDLMTDIPTIVITLLWQTYNQNTAYAINMVVNAVALMRLMYFTAYDEVMEAYVAHSDYKQALLA
jgi:hypothetical protein